jgi:transposase InsO family protein
MDGDAPVVLLRDRDDKFGPAFDRVAQGVGTKVIRTAVRAPNMNAVAERFVSSARRELLDHVLLVDDLHIASVLRQYQRYFNESRPHQGLGQRVPVHPTTAADPTKPIVITSVLSGLHVDYRRAA